jgi:hypothetical protein
LYGTTLRFLRSGGVKSGRFEEGEFVEAMDMKATDAAAAEAATVSSLAREAAAKASVEETNARAISRLATKILTFPPMIALLLAFASRGAPLPDALAAVLAPLAAANRPLVLITLGALFEPALSRLRLRNVANFLTTKYALSLVAAAVATTFAPPSLGPFRFAIAALVLMPVPSVCVQYALDHDADAVTATALTNYSQVASLVALLTLGFLSSGGAGATSAAWYVLPGGLLVAGAVVAGVGFALDRALAPVKMVFKPRDGSDGMNAPIVTTAMSSVAMKKPEDGDGDFGGAGRGPVVASAGGRWRGSNAARGGFGFGFGFGFEIRDRAPRRGSASGLVVTKCPYGGRATRVRAARVPQKSRGGGAGGSRASLRVSSSAVAFA